MRGELIQNRSAVADLARRCTKTDGVKRAQRMMGLQFGEGRFPTREEFAGASLPVSYRRHVVTDVCNVSTETGSAMTIPSTPQTPAETPACYRHPDRATYVRCSRCGRYTCPECLRDAAVGHQCVECVRAGAKTVRQPRTHFGGRQRSTPVVTYTLIALNVAMFVVQNISVDAQRHLVLWAPAIAHGEYYRLLSAAFLHYGVIHLLFNMWALYIMGRPLEMWLGRLRFSGLYLLSALGGSVLVYLLSPLNAATAGASGAVFGLFGATFVVARRVHLDVRWVIGLIGINLVLTFIAPGISWQGHIGGLVTGAVVAAGYGYAPRARRNLFQAVVTAGMASLLLVLVIWRTSHLLAVLG